MLYQMRFGGEVKNPCDYGIEERNFRINSFTPFVHLDGETSSQLDASSLLLKIDTWIGLIRDPNFVIFLLGGNNDKRKRNTPLSGNNDHTDSLHFGSNTETTEVG
jgi:hypothetical protein